VAEFLQFLISHGYLVIIAWMFFDQAGLPLPAAPLVIAAGVLVGNGTLSLPLVLLATLLGAVPVNLFWYLLGKSQGAKVLNLLCAISLEPDFCVKNTEATYRRLGPYSLLLAKFIPGLQTLAPPMAGLTGMPVARFVALDIAGTLLWAIAFIVAGAAFHAQLEELTRWLAQFGALAGLLLGAIFAVYIGRKLVQRRAFVRSLNMRRLQPGEVHDKLERGEPVHILDLRHSSDFKRLPEIIPNAVRVPMEAIEDHEHRIPRDSDIVLYCS
jgi:membrane protein DedA with SNARE-associated domain